MRLLVGIAKSKIFGIKFWNVTRETALNFIKKTIQNKEKKCVSFINAHCLNIAYTDEDYNDILKKQNCVLPDGVGVKLACWINGEKLTDNLNGTDLLPHICELAHKESFSIYLLGGIEGVPERMKKNLEKIYPGIKICGTQNGYFDRDNESPAIISNINEAKTNILMVGFGTPNQEKWMAKYSDKIDANIIMGVGGLFDFYSGNKKRAPERIRKMNLEWLYRLYLEPIRLWRRYLIGNPLYIWRIFHWRLFGG